MPIDEFIIKIYLMVDDYYKMIVTNRLRQGGYVPKLIPNPKNIIRCVLRTIFGEI